MQRGPLAMQDRSGAGLVPAEQADRLHLLEVPEPSAGRRMDHAEETAVIECVRADIADSMHAMSVL